MGVEDTEIVELVHQIGELEKKLYSHPLHKVCYVQWRFFFFPFALAVDMLVKGSSRGLYLTMILHLCCCSPKM